MNEAVRTFEHTKKQAKLASTLRLKVWLYLVRRRLEFDRTEANLVRQIALQDELRHRPRTSLRSAQGPVDNGFQRRAPAATGPPGLAMHRSHFPSQRRARR